MLRWLCKTNSSGHDWLLLLGGDMHTLCVRGGLVFPDELGALFVKLIGAELVEADFVDDEFVVDAFHYYHFYVVGVFLADDHVFEDDGCFVEDVAFGVESVVAIGEVFFGDAALVEEVHGFFPAHGYGFAVAFVNEHGHLAAVDDACDLAFGGGDHGGGHYAFVVDDDGAVGAFGGWFVDEVDDFTVFGLLDDGGLGGEVVDEFLGDEVGAEDEEFHAAVEHVCCFLSVGAGEAHDVVAFEGLAFAEAVGGAVDAYDDVFF